MGNYDGILGFAMKMVENNPQIRNNPNAQPMIDAIQRRDEQAGIQYANNILKSYGLTKEQGIGIAFQRLNLPKF